MFSLLLTTYALLDNVDVQGTQPRRPDSPDTGVSEEQPEKPVEQESTDSDLTPRIIQGTAIGGASAAAGNIANRVRKRRKAQEREEEEKKRRVEEHVKEDRDKFWGGQKKKGKPCCIASSVIGTSMMAQVNFLRNYREKIVKKSTKGQRSLNIAERIYYSMAPPIAKLDAKYEKFRLLTRTFWSGPIVSLLLCGMLLFNSGRKEFIRLQKTDPKLIMKIVTMGISASIFAISWIVWNCYLVIAVIYSGTLTDLWQPAAGMLIGIISLVILRTLYSDLPILSDDAKFI